MRSGASEHPGHSPLGLNFCFGTNEALGKDLSCFSITMPPCTKRGPYRNGGLHRALTSTPSNTFGMNWNTDCEPCLIHQHQCPTSPMLFKSNQTLFVTCAKYKYRLYREMLTYKPLTNRAVQEELRKYLPNRLKSKVIIKSNTIRITIMNYIQGASVGVK
jgi:hypothetical protein